MRKIFVGLAILTLATAACGSDDQGVGVTGATPATGPTGTTGTTGATGAPATAADCVAANADQLFAPDTFTIATDNPAFQPWFGGTGTYGDWKAQPNSGTGNPASGEGYESATAYAIAEEMGFSSDQVTWVPVNFNLSYKPGPVDYDVYVGQVSYTPQRAEAVSFSDAYFQVNQALVAIKGSPIASASSIADLTPYKLGAQVGTTSYQYIVDQTPAGTGPGSVRPFSRRDPSIEQWPDRRLSRRRPHGVRQRADRPGAQGRRGRPVPELR